MNGTGTDASAGELRASVRAMMERHWVAAGYTAPNTTVYPWLWLWDSCFHSLIWLELGDEERAITELRSAFSTQTESGFVPHMGYMIDPGASLEFWGRRGASAITQPPMYGHALAELHRRGLDVPADLAESAIAGIRFLLERRRRLPSGLVTLVHPWESGADDSPRWDSACRGGFSPEAWYRTKGELVRSIQRSGSGDPLANPDFEVAGAGFNALVVFNTVELVDTLGDAADPAGEHRALAEALEAQWVPDLETWSDAGQTEGGSARVRTVDALLPTLVDPDAVRVGTIGQALRDPTAYGGAYGPAGVHRQEPLFDPRGYWRGAAWPQLTYLLSIAQERSGHGAHAAELRRLLVAGAQASGLAEYWDPGDGTGLGAVPQSWAGLALLAGDQ